MAFNRVIHYWLLLALLAHLIRSADSVLPPVQSHMPVVDTLPLAFAFKHMPRGIGPLRNTRARIIGYHEQHNGIKSDSMYSRLVAMQLKHIGTCDPIRLDKKCVIYVIYNRSGDNRMYVGLTHLSAWGRFRTHLSAAGAYHRRPPGGRNIYQKAHLLYRIWGNHGIKNWAIFPMEVVDNPGSCSSKVFAHRHAAREAFWINTLKVLHPRGLNVRNDKPAKRALNAYRHRAQRLRKATPAGAPNGQSTTTATAPLLSTRGSNATPGLYGDCSSARQPVTLGYTSGIGLPGCVLVGPIRLRFMACGAAMPLVS